MAKLPNEMQNLVSLMKVPAENTAPGFSFDSWMVSKLINELASIEPQNILSCSFRPFNIITKVVSFRANRASQDSCYILALL